MNKFLFVAIFMLITVFNSVYASTTAYPPLPLNKILQFPKDHGVHPDTRFEWWYFTGHLYTPENRKFGFELTFFRIGINRFPDKSASAWKIGNLYDAHFAITDEHDNKFHFFENSNRDSLNLAGAKQNELNVWNGKWYAKMDGNIISLFANSENYSLTLQLKPVKPLVLQGKNGYSQVYKNIHDASYYYSFTRLTGSGELILDNKKFIISDATAWMDHEFSSSELGTNIGWDWFAIQLHNREELMVYQISYEGKREGAPYNFGIIHKANGELIQLGPNDFQLSKLAYWRSPNTNITYPLVWRLKIPRYHYDLILKPTIKNQEVISALPTYWEGSTTVVGKVNDEPVTGDAYIELTNYH